MSIESSENFPCLSTVAKVQRSDSGAYSIVAAADIDVGQPIIVEDLYHACVMRCFGIHCNICAKEYRNLVPCKKCAVAMFCPECEGYLLHKHECGLNFCGESTLNKIVLSSVRSILLAQKLFANVDEHMKFVEKMLQKPNELPENIGSF